MKIALLSNVTVEVLAGMLGREHKVWTPPGFGAWMETSLNPPEDMMAFGPDIICILIDGRYGAFDVEVQDVGRAVSCLKKTFPGARIIAPDLKRFSADLGERFYDDKMWKLGRMPFSIHALRELKKLFVPKKALAVDLDGTLWKGTVGEEGAEGVIQDVAFQRKLADLKMRGVLLVVLSKNSPEDGRAGLSALKGLRAEDFVSCRIDWNEKPENLAAVAQELNLGVDSFVFVDDSPVERAMMRTKLPEVTVADFPPQLDIFFPLVPATREDACKTEMYQAEAKRREFAANLSFDDYLAGLKIRTDIHLAREDEVLRIAQLSQKTNQFNVRSNRYSEDEIRGFLHDDDRLLVAVRSEDRFGDYGLVSFVLVGFVGGDVAEIVDWAMSCRVMNRRIEFEVGAAVEELLAKRGVKTLRASWRRTKKNVPVADLFDKMGYVGISVCEDGRDYEKSLIPARTCG